MANKKPNTRFSIVYVFGPTRCKGTYLNDEILNRENGEFVKIGKTDYAGNLCDCTVEALKDSAIKRCSQETRTGISDWCDIYDVFLFPQLDGQDVDEIIRNMLCNDVYSLDNSKAERDNMKGDIKPGKEYVYGVSRNHIKHAVESYCFQLVVAASSANINDIKRICEINAIMTDVDNEGEDQNNGKNSKRKNRDISLILSPGDIVYLTDSRDKNNPVMSGGKQIEATFVGNKKFRFDNEPPMFASPLAIELIKRFKGTEYDTISGNHCWTLDVEGDDGNIKRVTLADQYDSNVNS